jgi:hypothetical protein
MSFCSSRFADFILQILLYVQTGISCLQSFRLHLDFNVDNSGDFESVYISTFQLILHLVHLVPA